MKSLRWKTYHGDTAVPLHGGRVSPPSFELLLSAEASSSRTPIPPARATSARKSRTRNSCSICRLGTPNLTFLRPRTSPNPRSAQEGEVVGTNGEAEGAGRPDPKHSARLGTAGAHMARCVFTRSARAHHSFFFFFFLSAVCTDGGTTSSVVYGS